MLRRLHEMLQRPPGLVAGSTMILIQPSRALTLRTAGGPWPETRAHWRNYFSYAFVCPHSPIPFAETGLLALHPGLPETGGSRWLLSPTLFFSTDLTGGSMFPGKA